MRSLILSATVVAVVAVGGLYAWYRADLAAAERRISTGSTIASTSAVPIEYANTGTGEPFLVIHGSDGGFDQGLLIADRIVPAGYRVIAPRASAICARPCPTARAPKTRPPRTPHCWTSVAWNGR